MQVKLFLSAQLNMLTRFHGWEIILDKFLLTNSHRPFEWGEWDCGSFSAQAIQAITGVDMEAVYKDRHYSEKAVERLGGAEQVAVTCAIRWELTECAPQMSGRGDLVLLSNPPSEPCLAIIDLAGWPLKLTDNGLIRTGREFILRGWHI